MVLREISVLEQAEWVFFGHPAISFSLNVTRQRKASVTVHYFIYF